MHVNNVWGIAGALCTVALVTTIVTNRNSADVVKALFTGFSGSLLAAQGKS